MRQLRGVMEASCARQTNVRPRSLSRYVGHQAWLPERAATVTVSLTQSVPPSRVFKDSVE